MSHKINLVLLMEPMVDVVQLDKFSSLSFLVSAVYDNRTKVDRRDLGEAMKVAN